MRSYSGVMLWFVRILASITVLFSLCFLLGVFDKLGIRILPLNYRSMLAGFVLALVFLRYPPTKKAAKNKLPWYDAIFATLAFGCCLYHFIYYYLVITEMTQQ